MYAEDFLVEYVDSLTNMGMAKDIAVQITRDLGISDQLVSRIVDTIRELSSEIMHYDKSAILQCKDDPPIAREHWVFIGRGKDERTDYGGNRGTAP